MEVHEEGRHDEEEGVGHRVEELRDKGRELVVVLAPVHRGAAPAQMLAQHRHGQLSEKVVSLTKQAGIETTREKLLEITQS